MIPYTPLSPYTWPVRLDFQKLHLFYSLLQPNQVTASQSYPGDNPPERGRAVQKNSWPSKNGCFKLRHLHVTFSQASLHSPSHYNFHIYIKQPWIHHSTLSQYINQKRLTHINSSLDTFHTLALQQTLFHAPSTLLNPHCSSYIAHAAHP